MKDDNLEILRDQINQIDRRIIRLLAGRQRVVKDIFLIKIKKKFSIVNLTREKQLQSLHVKWAKELGISDVVVKKIFRLILIESKNFQRSLVSNNLNK